VVDTLYTDQEGNEVQAFSFRPYDAQGDAS